MVYLQSPNSAKLTNSNSPRNSPPNFQESVSSTYSTSISVDNERERGVASNHISNHNKENGLDAFHDEEHKMSVTSMPRISRGYNKRKENAKMSKMSKMSEMSK
eukprot:TRINITY_DN2508_c0_g1_i3.p2 TRINITY_DN2508_c0_g1~~TRINITY_DN2508_c0_g1_i3.p2  ORF type:complete len:104 (-),score=4.62 TRINITY_DN2508_c0_g1_i3:53-364(-)